MLIQTKTLSGIKRVFLVILPSIEAIEEYIRHTVGLVGCNHMFLTGK